MAHLYLLSERNKLLASLIHQARDARITPEEFRDLITRIGEFFGYEIANLLDFEPTSVTTPLGAEAQGFKPAGEILLISSFEDADYFARGIRLVLPNVKMGKIEAVRQQFGEQWRASIQRVSLPKDVPEEGTIIIAKAVLASGCTAIALIGETLKLSKPKRVIVAAIIAHKGSYKEIEQEYPYIPIQFVIGEEDPILDNRGFVVPGIGNIPERLGIK